MKLTLKQIAEWTNGRLSAKYENIECELLAHIPLDRPHTLNIYEHIAEYEGFYPLTQSAQSQCVALQEIPFQAQKTQG